jgi:type IV pilus assembly protein PilC
MDESSTSTESVLSAATAEVVIERAAQIAAAGMPLPAGLRAAAEEVDSRRVARALLRVAAEIDRGRTLEQIVAKSRLPPHLSGLIRAAQRTPRLPLVLAEWLHYRRAAREHLRNIAAALVYPAIAIALATCVLALFATLIVPTFRQMYEEFELKLPAMTIYFLWYCETILPVLGASVAVAFLAAIGLRLLGGRAGWSWLMTTVPLVGLPWHWAGVTEMLRCLGLLIEQRVPLPEALRLTAGGISDAYVAEQCRVLAHRVEGGSSLTMALVDLRTLPLSIVPLVRWGESRGLLTEALRSSADMIESRLDRRADLLTQVVPPMLLVFVGATVASGVIALFLPLVTLLQGLS